MRVRKYRTGELPDFQRVTIAAFLGPLGRALHFLSLLHSSCLIITLRRPELSASFLRLRVRKYRTGELPDVQRNTIAALLGHLGRAN